ncbi:MAG: hypothetical protein JWM57_2218 [Phycisphaerales bacterium]|nr:hypothetical protein [Phycisphaerales bacterium]
MTTRAAPSARSGAMSTRAKLAFLAIVLLAIALRVTAIVYTHGTAAAPEENRLIATNLAAGRGFTFTEFGVTGPTAIRGPVYPMLLALVGPDRMRLILAINVLASAGTVLAAAALTRHLLSPLPDDGKSGPESPPAPMPRGAWAAAVLFAVWPTQLYAATLTQGLSIAVLLALAAFALALKRTPVALIAGGLLAALAALTEPVLALPLLFAAIALGWRRRASHAALFIGTAMVLIAPWLYRNAVIFGRPMPITSNFWRDAFLGNSSFDRDASSGTQLRNKANPISHLSPREFDQLKAPEPQRNLVFREWTIHSIEVDPRKYAWRCLDRASAFVFGHVDHPLAKHWLYQRTVGLELIWIPIFAVWPKRHSRVAEIVIFITIGLGFATILTREDARLSALRSAPMLLAVAVAYQRFAQRKKPA